MKRLLQTSRTLRIVAIIASMTVGAVVCLGPTAKAADIQPKVAIPLFLKIVTYDDAFVAAKDIDTVRIYVLYDYSNAKSYGQYLDTRNFFLSQVGLTLSKIPIRVYGVESKVADSALNSVPEAGYSLMLCTDIDDRLVHQSTQTVRTKHLRTFSFDLEKLDSGIAVSVSVEPKKTSIVVNLKAAKAEGSRFNSRLLSLCQIVDHSG